MLGMGSADDVLLEVRDLCVDFRTDAGTVRAVDGVSWSVRRGRTLAIVGESGCGKSVTALAVLRLIPDPPGRIAGGKVLFHANSGREPIDLTATDERELCSIRGGRISLVFQEAMSALNPVLTVGQQIVEAIELHQHIKGQHARDAAVDLLRGVGIPAPDQRSGDYPHQMSGGMRQRVLLAMALAGDPELLIADEPTTALDVTVQAQILELLRERQAQTGMSVVFITHDLGVVAQTADEVCVMYAGRVVERAEVRELFDRPLHPYTRALLECVPRVSEDCPRVESIPGTVPDPAALPTGCRFHPRCSKAVPSCGQPDGDPVLRELSPDHFVACPEVDSTSGLRDAGRYTAPTQ
jgi:oligopeptide/dipeptide ABC transporter ATP-binding protein